MFQPECHIKGNMDQVIGGADKLKKDPGGCFFSVIQVPNLSFDCPGIHFKEGCPNTHR